MTRGAYTEIRTPFGARRIVEGKPEASGVPRTLGRVVDASPDGARAVTHDYDSGYRLLKMPEGTLITALEGVTRTRAEPWPVSFSADGTRFAISLEDRLLFYESSKGELLNALDVSQRRGRGIALNADGSLAAVLQAAPDAGLLLVDTRRSAQVEVWPAVAIPEGLRLTDPLAFSPDGTVLAAATEEGPVALFTVRRPLTGRGGAPAGR